MENRNAVRAQVAELEAAAGGAARAGRDPEALRLWQRILEIDPAHVPTLSMLGQRAFRTGDVPAARALFQRVVDADGTVPQQWIHLALACRADKDEAGEAAALTRALELDPMELLALILRGDLLERQGRRHEAARVHQAVATVAPPVEALRPELREAVSKAIAETQKYRGELEAFMDGFMGPHLHEFEGEDLRRFRTALDIMVGRKKRYDSQSLIFHYPGLAPIEFFDRELFPWLEGLEAATEAVREEFLAVLAEDAGFEPYIQYRQDLPRNQFAELNHSPRWSAFHLRKSGALVPENAGRCPRTMEALAPLPQPDQPGRTPNAMFSLLKPRTTIPPHTGVTNTRLVTHLPLIIPEGCTFRVGNDVRKWVPGRAWVFDDTIEHEARNDSDELRVILMFDVWHPHLTPPERALITALSKGVTAFSGDAEGFDRF